ncbi:MAG TPA: septal ring lytic transglycosylase RlpA family protein, partial [Candidatus Caenarcaniphilales bacterium]
RRQLGDAPPLSAILEKPVVKLQRFKQIALGAIRSRLKGLASWYGPGFHGNRTASGERYNQYALTAAHRSLPFGTRVQVTNLHNNRSVVVRINDRGPYSHGRVIDLSRKAAQLLGVVTSGVAPVRVDVLR